MTHIEKLQIEIKNFILEEFLPDEDPDDLTIDIELVSTGILDSVSVISVIAYLEATFNIKVEAHEASPDNMNTIESIANLVASKTAS